MPEGVSIAELLDWSGWGVMALAVAVGMLIPRWTHTQRLADKQEQIDYLRAIVDKREDQLALAISNSEVVLKLLEDIKRAAETR
jgi:hypothetical protein